jgi:hypothetical protein
MALVLKVGEFDVSPFVRVAHEDGMDPADSEYSEPQFSGSPAFGEGQEFAGESVNNRLMPFPVIISAPNTDALYEQIREIDAELVKGNQVEFRSGGASQSTFFDLEAGRLDIEFEFWLDQAAKARGTLHLWTRPRGTTGTTRQVVSVAAGSAAVMQLPATGIIGDRPALANFEIRVGLAAASNGRIAAYAVHPHPSFNGLHSPTPGLAQPGAIMRGASGAVGSQFLAIPVSPTTASGVAYTAFLTPPDAHVGRHRVLAIGRSGLNVPLSIYAEDRFGAALGATALATQTDVNKWQVLDLGEVQVPSRMPGQEPVPTQSVSLVVGGASGALINASPAFHLDSLMFLPLDHSAGIMRTRGGQPPILKDSFATAEEGFDVPLEKVPADTGQVWSRTAGGQLFKRGRTIYLGFLSQHLAGATAFYDVASGALYADVTVGAPLQLGPNVTSPSQASGIAIEIWAKRNPGLASAGVWARMMYGPSQTLQLLSGNGSTATVLASAGIASTLASGVYQGQAHLLTLRILGARADIWFATGPLPASPILSASNAVIGQLGNPALRVFNGGSQIGAPFSVNAPFAVANSAATAVDIGAREWFRFESYPEKRVFQGNASVFRADRTRDHRGDLPRLPAVGSPMPTGPAQVVFLAGEIDNFVGNDGCDFVAAVREQFTYLR